MSLEALRNLTDIGLFVSDLERAIAFYGETLVLRSSAATSASPSSIPRAWASRSGRSLT